MRNLYLYVIFTLFISCGNEEKNIADQSIELQNPLDAEGVKSKFARDAIELKDLSKIEQDGKDFYTLISNGMAYSGWVKVTHTSGFVTMLFECKDGLVDGLMTTWLQNGSKLTETTFATGKREGLFIIRHENGEIHKTGRYLNNLLEGRVIEYYPSAELKTKFDYKSGEIFKARRWRPDGSLCSLSKVEGGRGMLMNYDQDPTTPDSNTTYLNGEVDFGYPPNVSVTIMAPDELKEANTTMIDESNRTLKAGLQDIDISSQP